MTLDIVKKDFIYEGKAKRLFSTNEEDKVWIEFKDDLTAFNAEKKGSFAGKGQLNLAISTCIFEYLQKNNIPTHFVKKISETELVVKKVKIIPLEVVIRNIAAGSICKRLAVEGGKHFKSPLFEIFYKSDVLGDPFLSYENAEMLGICNWEEYNHIKEVALKINDLLKAVFLKTNVDLVDFKIEFGKTKDGDIVLADEISPDSCRLWDVDTKEILDKDRFRKDLGRVEESYKEILKRLKEVI